MAENIATNLATLLQCGTKRERALALSGEAFLESLQKNGASSTLHLLIRLSANVDWMVNELLYLFAATVTMSDFLKKIPSYQVTEEKFQHWCQSPEFLFGPRRQGLTGVQVDGEEIKAILKKVGVLMAEKKAEKKEKKRTKKEKAEEVAEATGENTQKSV